jgi:hypothetical protein
MCLAACGGGDEEASTVSPSASVPVEETPSGEIQDVPVLKENWEGIRADVTVDECPTDAGDVTAQGTVVNSAKKARDIVIVISWNAPDSTDPLLQLSVTKKGVPAGETVDWSASGELPADAGQCIVLARSGELGKG